MWKPIRNNDKEAYQLVKHFARQGLEKALDKTNQAIKKTSDKLVAAHDNNSSIKRRSKIRMELDSKCIQRNRLERALELLNET